MSDIAAHRAALADTDFFARAQARLSLDVPAGLAPDFDDGDVEREFGRPVGGRYRELTAHLGIEVDEHRLASVETSTHVGFDIVLRQSERWSYERIGSQRQIEQAPHGAGNDLRAQGTIGAYQPVLAHLV